MLQSQIKAIEEIKPGMTTKEVDALSRDYIKAHGYGNEFGHSLGHGIGLDIHEGPVLSKILMIQFKLIIVLLLNQVFM